MTASFYIYKQSRIRYYSFGEGDSLIFCLHGYGENGKVFQILENQMGNSATFISIDLPYHGETEWKEAGIITNSALWEIVQGILAKQPGQKPIENIHLLGFSLGARIALSLYEYNPEAFKKLVLLAPDGLKLNFWYWLATQTIIGQTLFKFTTRHSGWFMGLLKISNRFQLVNASIYKFTFHYLKDKNSRALLYQRWIGLRKFRPDLKDIKKKILTYHTPVRLVYGKYDRIIVPGRGEKFQKGIELYCSITILDSGHQILYERNVKEIALLLENNYH